MLIGSEKDLRYKINRNNITLILAIFGFFLCAWAPATQGSSLSDNSFKLIIKYSYFVIGIGLFILNFWRKKICLYQLLLILSPLFYYLFGFIWHYQMSETFGVSVSATLICVGFALSDEIVKKKVYTFIKFLLIVMSIVGIVCYMSYLFHLGLPYKTIPYYGDVGGVLLEKFGVSYSDFHVCYLYNELGRTRLCGLFNEPGWFGTFLAFYLCEEELNFKKFYNIIVFIAGILTFSIAFILLIVIYYVVSNLRNWKKWIWIIFLIIFVAFILPNIKTGNLMVDHTLERLSVFSNGLGKDGRTSQAYDQIFSEFMNSSYVFFGHGSNYTYYTLNGVIGSTIKTDLMDFGFVGTMFIYGLPIISLILLNNYNKKVLAFLFCVVISLFQRNWFYEPSNFIYVLAIVSYITMKEQDELNIKHKGNYYD